MFNTKRYDSIEDVFKEHPLSTLRYDDIMYRFSSGIGQDTYAVGSNGKKYVSKRMYRHGVQTNVGDMKKDVWAAIAKQIIDMNNDSWLLDCMVEWYSKTLPGKLKQNEAYFKGLNTITRGLHNDMSWVDDVPFNAEYRSSELEGKILLTLLPSCCNKPFQATGKMKNFEDKYCCEHCGIWSDYELLGEEAFNPDYLVKK